MVFVMSNVLFKYYFLLSDVSIIVTHYMVHVYSYKYSVKRWNELGINMGF